MTSARARIWCAAALLLAALLGTLPGNPSAAAAACTGRAEAVVKLKPGRSISEVLPAYRIELAPRLLWSRGLYAVRSTDPTYCGTYDWSAKLADQVEDHVAVAYAASNYPKELSDGRYHGWPDGKPGDVGTNPTGWTSQLAVSQLKITQAHAITRGAGIVLAVLDTGVDPTHPALQGRLLPSWDYVDDDATPVESRNAADDDSDGAVDESFGHGTFVSGVVALVAPESKILPMRVLDSDGRGNVFVAAEAIADAVTAGADVITLSFGTGTKPMTSTMEMAIKDAQRQGVVVVASAGNESSKAEHFPAAQSELVGVSALAADRRGLATFSNFGSWVDVAAPGTDVIGPFPSGRYVRWNGTSVSAPFVAGQVALMRAAAPQLGPTQLADTIKTTATLIQPPNADAIYAIDVGRSTQAVR